MAWTYRHKCRICLKINGNQHSKQQFRAIKDSGGVSANSHTPGVGSWFPFLILTPFSSPLKLGSTFPKQKYKM